MPFIYICNLYMYLHLYVCVCVCCWLMEGSSVCTPLFGVVCKILPLSEMCLLSGGTANVHVPCNYLARQPEVRNDVMAYVLQISRWFPFPFGSSHSPLFDRQLRQISHCLETSVVRHHSRLAAQDSWASILR